MFIQRELSSVKKISSSLLETFTILRIFSCQDFTQLNFSISDKMRLTTLELMASLFTCFAMEFLTHLFLSSTHSNFSSEDSDLTPDGLSLDHMYQNICKKPTLSSLNMLWDGKWNQERQTKYGSQKIRFMMVTSLLLLDLMGLMRSSCGVLDLTLVIQLLFSH